MNNRSFPASVLAALVLGCPGLCVAGPAGLPVTLPGVAIPNLSVGGGNGAPQSLGGSAQISGTGSSNAPAGALNMQGMSGSFGSSPNDSTGPDAKWGDPLSVNLLGNDQVQVRLKYFGEVGANGSSQAVGLKLTWPE